jgi:hypothetical protein
MLRLRVLSWNLGPGNFRWQDLAAVLAGWEWDVAALRGLPPRWPLPLTKSLDAEFRYAPTGAAADSGVRRILSWAPVALAGPRSGLVDAIVARRDRIVSEWPRQHRGAQRTGVHGARLACGVWVGNQNGVDESPRRTSELTAVVGDDALALAGPRAGMDGDPGASGLSHRGLIEVARGGEDGIWATPDLIPVAEPEVLAGGALRGNPPLAVTLEHLGRARQP